MNIEIMGVYLVDFKENIGAEFSGKHYALVITNQIENTFSVIPITSKKSGKKYRHGVTIDNLKYSKEPTYDKSFLLVRKMREIDRKRILSKKRYSLDNEDIERVKMKIKEVFKL